MQPLGKFPLKESTGSLKSLETLFSLFNIPLVFTVTAKVDLRNSQIPGHFYPGDHNTSQTWILHILHHHIREFGLYEFRYAQHARIVHLFNFSRWISKNLNIKIRHNRQASSLKEIQDFSQLAIYKSTVIAYDTHADPTSLPLVLEIDFSHRYIEPLMQTRCYRANYFTLCFERTTFRNLNINFQETNDRHRVGSKKRRRKPS